MNENQIKNRRHDMNTIGRLLPAVHDRVPLDRPQNVHTPEQTYVWAYDQLTTRTLHDTFLIHCPAGWHHSMTSAQWSSMTEDMQIAWTNAIDDAQRVRPELKVLVYLGLQHYGSSDIQGDPRPPGYRFDQEPWAEPWSWSHRWELLDLTILPWMEIDAVNGVVFDLGSKKPDYVVGWKALLQRIHPHAVVGIEALPLIAGASINWTWAKKYGLHYHALEQFVDGKPFEQTVPPDVSAYCWLRNGQEQTDEWIRGVVDRGWNLVVDDQRDGQVAGVLEDRT